MQWARSQASIIKVIHQLQVSPRTSRKPFHWLPQHTHRNSFNLPLLTPSPTPIKPVRTPLQQPNQPQCTSLAQSSSSPSSSPSQPRRPHHLPSAAAPTPTAGPPMLHATATVNLMALPWEYAYSLGPLGLARSVLKDERALGPAERQ